jgi:replicative DNA helicase
MEAAVLGAMLLDPRAAEIACRLLAPGDFYKGAHRQIFETAREIVVAGQPLDQGLLCEALKARGQLDEVGGVAGILELADKVATSAHVESYCAIVRERALLRRIADVAARACRTAGDPGARPEGTLAELEKGLADIRHASALGKGRSHSLSQAFGDVSRLIAGGRKLLRPAGFEKLLDLLPGRGLWPGLYVLGGPPGIGKTTFATQFIEACLECEPTLKALMMSGEMSDADIFLSCLARRSGVDLSTILEANGSQAEKDVVQRCAVALAERTKDRWLLMGPPLKVSDMRNEARAMRPGLLAVDYLQLLEPDGEYTMAKDRIDAVARELMLLRVENPDAPILLLASHNRGEAKRPYAPGRGLGAYKETGNIEYTADRCLNLEYTDETYDAWRKGEMEAIVWQNLILLKNRMGRPGKVEVKFDGPYQQYELMRVIGYQPPKADPVLPLPGEDYHVQS